MLVIWQLGDIIQAAEFIRVGWIQGEYTQYDIGNKKTFSAKRRYKSMNEIMWKDGFMILNQSIGFLE